MAPRAPRDNQVSDRALLDIIEHVYATSCDPTQWSALADACRRLFPGTAFSLHITLEAGAYDPVPEWAGWDPHFIELYKQHYYRINPFTAILRPIRPGRVVRASELVTRRWIDRQPFYQEWLKPAGNFTHAAGVTLMRSANSLTRLSYNIPEDLAEVEGAAADVLRRLAPHFRRALEIAGRLGGRAAAETALAALLEQVGDCAIAIDRRRRVRFANRRALALLESRALIAERPSRGLSFVAHEAEEAFTRALEGCLGTIERPAAASFMVRVGSGRALPVHVLPLRTAGSFAAAGANAAVALVVIGAERSRAVPPDTALRSLYGLSRREADVALLIAEGASARETASRLGVSTATTRNQLAAAMAKLGVHRRAELVALLAGLLPRLGGEPPEPR